MFPVGKTIKKCLEVVKLGPFNAIRDTISTMQMIYIWLLHQLTAIGKESKIFFLALSPIKLDSVFKGVGVI